MSDDYTRLDAADVAPNISGAAVMERAKARAEALRQKEVSLPTPPKPDDEQPPEFDFWDDAPEDEVHQRKGLSTAEKPTIDLTGRQLDEVVAKTFDALKLDKTLFRYGGALVQMAAGGKLCHFATDSAPLLLSKNAEFVCKGSGVSPRCR